MNRFTLRGKTKVNPQWLMYCMVHNIEKIATQRQQQGGAQELRIK
ncbi:transposase [Nitrincola alkalisediminis]|nr:transposase [Nitrincola alkalisediminis]